MFFVACAFVRTSRDRDLIRYSAGAAGIFEVFTAQLTSVQHTTPFNVTKMSIIIGFERETCAPVELESPHRRLDIDAGVRGRSPLFCIVPTREACSMIVSLAANHELQVEDPLQFKAFSVRLAPGDEARATGAVILRDGYAWVSQEALRSWPPMAQEPAWQSGLTAMINFASTRGWVDPESGRIRAHIEAR